MTDRIPSQALDMEQAVLGAMLIEPTAIDKAAAMLVPGDFYRQAHGAIFAAMTSLRARREPVDLLSVKQELGDALEPCGGWSYLLALMDVVPSAANVEHYAGRVRECSCRRTVARTCSEVIEANAHDEPLGPMVARTVEMLRACELRASGERASSDHSGRVGDWFDAKVALREGGAPSGMMTGIALLDRMTLGIERGQYWVLKAPSSAGKTALALQIADNVSRTGRRVMVDSHEMSARDIYDRMGANSQAIDLRRLRAADLEPDEWHRVGDFAAELSTRKTLAIREPLDARASGTIAAARRIPNLDLLIVDYIQRLDGEDARATEVVKTMQISRDFANFAHHGGPAVIVLSQQNDEGKTAWARSIFNDADVLIGIVPDEKARYADVMDCILVIEKQRNGPTGNVPVRMHRSYTRFAGRA